MSGRIGVTALHLVTPALDEASRNSVPFARTPGHRTCGLRAAGPHLLFACRRGRCTGVGLEGQAQSRRSGASSWCHGTRSSGTSELVAERREFLDPDQSAGAKEPLAEHHSQFSALWTLAVGRQQRALQGPRRPMLSLAVIGQMIGMCGAVRRHARN